MSPLAELLVFVGVEAVVVAGAFVAVIRWEARQ